MRISEQEQFHELSYYTLGHPDKKYFIHQHIVDAYTVQNADKDIKPIAITFSLVGLCLFIEKNYSGREVQLVHMQMAKNKKAWSAFILPEQRGEIRISDVLAASQGKERDLMIKRWCTSVWQAYSDCHVTIETIIRSYKIK